MAKANRVKDRKLNFEERRLILACKEKRRQAREELKAMGHNDRRNSRGRDRARELRSYIDGLTDAKLAEKFDCGRSTIQHIELGVPDQDPKPVKRIPRGI